VILEIFKSHYGTEHPIQFTLTEEFWRESDKFFNGETLTSLILEDERTGEGIAHIALAFRAKDCHAEILLPAITNEWRHAIGSVFHKFYLQIQSLSQRRNWSHFVSICVASDPFYQYVSTSYFGCEAASLLPRNQIHYTKDYVISLYSPIKISRYNKPFYINDKLRSRVLPLIRSLGFAVGKPKNEKESPRKLGISRVKRQPRTIYGIEYLDIHPMLFELKKFKKNSFTRYIYSLPQSPIIRLHLDSPESIAIYNELEQLGFRYSGIELVESDIVLLLSMIEVEEARKIILYGAASREFRDSLLFPN